MSRPSVAEFLQDTTWANWTATRIAQDASARSYIRLSQKSQSVILMDAPPSANEDVRPFVQMSELLLGMGLSPPRILAQDQAQGFLVLEDLGATDFAKAITHNPESATDLYRAAADVLVHIGNQPAPPLKTMAAETAGDMVRITAEHYAKSAELSDQLAQSVTQMFRAHCGPADTLALRDFHAENLIWRPNETGHKRVGLLDFQDAFVAPSGYDLASLIRDARRDIDNVLATDILTYVSRQTNEDLAELALRVRCLAVQRNLRILGVFARLIAVQGKTRYAAMLPRVWTYILDDLDHPALTDLQAVVRDCLPPPGRTWSKQ